MKKLSKIAISIIILFSITGCAKTPIIPVEDQYPRLGIAGLIPRNFPNPSSADWLDLFSHLSETGELVGVYTPWTDSKDSEGQIPRIIKTAFEIQSDYGIDPVIALGFYTDDNSGNLYSSVDWKSEEQRDRIQKTVQSIAETYKPPYFALGVEVNRFYQTDPDGFDDFVNFYKVLYLTIKKYSADTKVFPIFQYELVRGGLYFSGDQEMPDQWQLMDRFTGFMDLAVFTTYPFLLYQSPQDIPDNYYSEISNHTSLPIGFTEIGWPSAPIVNSEFGGSDKEQVDFINSFFKLTKSMPLEFALWSFPHDIGEEANLAFINISLRLNNGDPKPSLKTWESYK